MNPIRNSAKAVIWRGTKLLLTRNTDGRGGYFYLFPGGGQEPGEELRDAVVRECLEETGLEVEVGELLHVREYIGRNHQFAEWDSEIHQVEFYFECRLDEGVEVPENGPNPDSSQVGVEWVEVQRLDSIELYPERLKRLLRRRGERICYLGDTN
ncbi:ADP-ribose pyrophosphatase YjhB (NUDIX family) [Paenibacillus mucilaginosus]|uniref:NUDIX domain-containing protein n=1 Tax=Paenibacillus mucilaginosus TaxID=61624 RepID=UPI003D1BA176